MDVSLGLDVKPLRKIIRRIINGRWRTKENEEIEDLLEMEDIVRNKNASTAWTCGNDVRRSYTKKKHTCTG